LLVILFFFVGFFWEEPIYLKAQNRILTLEESLKMAQTNGSLAKQYRYAHEAATQGIQLQKANYWPTLQFLANVSHANEAPRIPVEFENDTVLARQGTQDTFISRFELTQMLYDFGKTSHAVEAARYQAESVDADYKHQNIGLNNQVREEFYKSLYYQKLDSIYSAIIPFSEELATISKVRIDNGVALSPEVLKSQVDLQDLLAQHASAQNEYRKALVQLAYLTGQPNIDFSTKGRLPGVPETKNLSMYYPSMYQLALAHRADINQLVSQSKQQAELAKSIDALKYPTLTLQSDFSYFGPDAFGYYSGLSSRGLNPVNWRVGIGFTFTLFNGFRIRTQKNQSLALNKQYQEQVYQLKQQISSQIQMLLKDLESLRVLKQSNELLLSQINASIKIMETSYANGNIPRLEYIKAIIPKATAEANLQKTRSDIAQVLVKLQTTIGTDISTIWQKNE